MALAQISELRRLALPKRAARLETVLESGLKSLQAQFPDRVSRVSVIGLMGGIAWRRADGGPDTELSVAIMQEVLRQGILLLPEGEHSEVTGITPPLTITETELKRAFREIARAVSVHLQISNPAPKPKLSRTPKKRL